MIGYYRRFVKNFCEKSALLTPATLARESVKVQWMLEMLEAFYSLCSSLIEYCILNVPLSSDTFVMHTDAFSLGVGCVLNVHRDGETLPVAFYSHII